MADRSIAIRLKAEGKATVVADLDAIGAAGDASASRLKRAYERDVGDAEAALERLARTQAKIAAITPATATQMRVDASAGTGYGQWEGSARQSAAAFRELIAEQERLEERTKAFTAALYPAVAAQERFDREIGEARSLISAGTISLDAYCDKLRLERAELDRAVAAGTRAHGSIGAQRAGLQQLGFQLNDTVTSLASGSKATTVFAQQLGQTLQAVQLMSGGTSAFATFIGGPWGIALSAGLIALGPLVSYLLDTEKAAKAAEAASKDLANTVGDIGNFFDRTTGKIKETNRALVQFAFLSRQQRIDTLRNQQRDAQTTGNAALAQSRRNREVGYTLDPDSGASPVMAAGSPDIDRVFRSRTNIDAQLRQIAGSGSVNAGLAAKILEQRAQFARSAEEIARTDKEIQSLLGGTLDASLRTGGGGARTRGRAGGGGSSAAGRIAAEARDAQEEVQRLLADLRKLATQDWRIDPAARADAARQAEERQRANFKAIFGDEDPLAGVVQHDADLKKYHDRMEQVLQVENERREQGIRTAADLYRDLMTGGVNSIWQRFESYGMDVLSKLLAQWTLGAEGSKGGGWLSSLGSLFGIARGGASIPKGVNAVIPGKNAAGTEYWSGGATWLAENGPEIVTLPPGSKVTPAAETRRRLAGNDNGGSPVNINYQIDARGSDGPGLARLEAQFAEHRKALPGIIRIAMADTQARAHGR